MPTELQAALQALAAEPRTDYPFLSLYLDWTTDSNGKRQALLTVQQELEQIAARLPGSGPLYESFVADRDAIMTYLSQDAPKDARGLIIFACDGTDVWAPLPLQVAVETYIAEDRSPHIFHLAKLLDDYETYAIVLADAQESRIIVVALDALEEAGATQASEDISRVQVGGWSQRRYQSHTDYVISTHTKDMAVELDKVIKQYDVQHVIIGGNDAVKGAIIDSLTAPIKEKLIDYVNADTTLSLPALRELFEPRLRERERAQEADEIARLEEQMVTKGGLGAAGVAAVALALSKGQVQRLLLLQSFDGVGGECPICGFIRAGQRANCPYDGTEMLPVNLREAFTIRAINQGAALQIVEASEYLDQYEGVGAVLRYRDDEQALGGV